MRTLLIAIIASVCWLAPSYAQNSGKSAREVWEAFEANPSDMYIFLDGLADSDNPQGYKRYIYDFVSTCIRRDISWDVLFDEMKETVLPKDSSVASIFCACLVKATKDLSNKRKVMQVMPKSCSEDDNTYLSGNYIKMIPGGMLMEGYDSRDADFIDYNQSHKMDMVMSEVHQYGAALLCLPDGTMKYGKFKKDNPLELYIGYTLDNQGKVISETCMGYDSFDKALNSLKKKEAAREKAIGDVYNKQYAQMKARLVKQYGVKAFNAMTQGRPYVGMPEGIIRDFGTPYPDHTGNRDNDKFVHAYSFSHTDIGGFKIYQSSDLYVYMGAPKQPTYVYCKGGRVTAIKW